MSLISSQSFRISGGNGLALPAEMTTTGVTPTIEDLERLIADLSQKVEALEAKLRELQVIE